MSCLPSAPPPDLATKDFVAAEEKRAADRAAADKHYRQLRAVGILIAVEIPAFEAGWLDWFKDIAASPF